VAKLFPFVTNTNSGYLLRLRIYKILTLLDGLIFQKAVAQAQVNSEHSPIKKTSFLLMTIDVQCTLLRALRVY